MSWQQTLQMTEVTAEQLVMGRQALLDYDDTLDLTRLEFLRTRWPEWGDAASAVVVIRLRALDDFQAAGRLNGMDLLDGALMSAAAWAPIRVVDKSAWEMDWPRFLSIAHEVNRSEMQGLGLIPMDDEMETPPEAANDTGEGA